MEKILVTMTVIFIMTGDKSLGTIVITTSAIGFTVSLMRILGILPRRTKSLRQMGSIRTVRRVNYKGAKNVPEDKVHILKETQRPKRGEVWAKKDGTGKVIIAEASMNKVYPMTTEPNVCGSWTTWRFMEIYERTGNSVDLSALE